MKFTSAQLTAIKQTIESLVLAAVIAGCIALGSYITNAGSLVVLAVLLRLGHGVSAYLKTQARVQAATNPQQSSAELSISDLLDALLTTLKSLYPAYSVANNALSSVNAAPLVVIHTSGAPTVTTTAPVITNVARPSSTPVATNMALSISDNPTPSVATKDVKSAVASGGATISLSEETLHSIASVHA